MITQLDIGFFNGFLLGVAVFSSSFSRAIVTGLIVGIVIGGIMIAGVEGYVRWATYLPAQMAKLSGLWIGLIAGVLGGRRLALADAAAMTPLTLTGAIFGPLGGLAMVLAGNLPSEQDLLVILTSQQILVDAHYLAPGTQGEYAEHAVCWCTGFRLAPARSQCS